jgi:hypothetical protein
MPFLLMMICIYKHSNWNLLNSISKNVVWVMGFSDDTGSGTHFCSVKKNSGRNAKFCQLRDYGECKLGSIPVLRMVCFYGEDFAANQLIKELGYIYLPKF